MDQLPQTISPPPRWRLLFESRVLLDAARMTAPLLRARIRSHVAERHNPVMVIPGFGSGDGYTRPLRYYLSQHGHAVEGWGMGRNLAGLDLKHTLDDLSDRWQPESKDCYRGEAGVPYLCDRLVEHVQRRSEQEGVAFALVGWSLGGYLAREVARDLPDHVSQVITLGSPVTGGPKYTAAADVFRGRGMDVDWIEQEIHRRENRAITQPITAIVSKSDAIVQWQAAMDHHSEQVEHIHLNVSHLGMGFNPEVWRLVRNRLADTD